MDPAGAVTRAVADFAAAHLTHRDVCVGLSGGPDSLALTAAAVRAGLRVHALVVDHQLQSSSAQVAADAAATARDLGASATILPVDVGARGGLEAAARTARYAALDAARDEVPVLLGHTMDDQAETVLLGLARGSGPRSIAGMRAWRSPWGRPLLGIRRAQTHDACAAWGLDPHTDPHNGDPRFTRVRLRTEVMPLLDDVLSGGVVGALARTAEQLRADAEALDVLADDLLERARRTDGLDLAPMRGVPTALRTRVLRAWLIEVGATEPTSRVIGAVDDLASGPPTATVAIGGDPSARLVVRHVGGVLVVGSVPR
ncbi:tRNA lysidine(34) synthetase TilS [Gordonia sp. ABSL1-1]|uniref:tRNA lysidine(34) synthetase TilS n=1 Tax=Gordonia sp. ABSL1-1 TaxID=3053923 RepID=UPI0025722C67|nr:tRNA lysidine(34) synthetase TilS [Gordonia sp. ABSL1-1]MDL9938594.1 tRNA lysidine(34) synthetase TilS [Gordonia sp. ABSL1-1]